MLISPTGGFFDSSRVKRFLSVFSFLLGGILGSNKFVVSELRVDALIEVYQAQNKENFT